MCHAHRDGDTQATSQAGHESGNLGRLVPSLTWSLTRPDRPHLILYTSPGCNFPVLATSNAGSLSPFRLGGLVCPAAAGFARRGAGRGRTGRVLVLVQGFWPTADHLRAVTRDAPDALHEMWRQQVTGSFLGPAHGSGAGLTSSNLYSVIK